MFFLLITETMNGQTWPCVLRSDVVLICTNPAVVPLKRFQPVPVKL